ncbi:MAG TPA: alpha/beta hydrolase domain-containing protein [Chloroflexota bacterium]|jgi:hypothetical protein
MVAPMPQTQAGVTSVTITRQEVVPAAVTGAAPYLKLAGTFRGAVDPNDRRNAVIADLARAPRTNGLVEYESTFYVLRPADPAAGNGKVYYDFGNRGNKRILQWFNDGAESNDPTTADDFGHGYLMREGYTVVWSGWAGDLDAGENVMSITMPIARNPDGSAITGQVATELIPARDSQTTIALPYPAASLDAANGTLTVREHSGDAREPVSGWSYDGPNRVRLAGPARIGHIYEFVYEATDPPVMGLGHAATRDFLSLLRYGGGSEAAARLVPGGARQVYAWGRSQGGRVQRDFLYYGFNEDLQGRRVFDGMMPYATGVGRMYLNVRWAQPTVSNQQHSRRYAPEHEFPHRYATTSDPVSGETDGLLARCAATSTCPVIMNVESANEYWNKGSSLNQTDALGNDVDIDAEAPNVRLYAIAGIQHNTVFDAVPAVAQCQQLTNPLYNGPVFRALSVLLDHWVTEGAAPPASRVPRRADGTLVDPAAIDFPAIPGTRYGELPSMPPAAYHPDSAKPIALLDFAAVPARVLDPAAYWRGVSQVDADGNEVAGIRLPDLVAPTGTYTGWALMKPGAGGPDLCGQLGQFIPFATTRAERLASGDSRLSLEERYSTAKGYVDAVAAAAHALEADGLLLAEDRERIVAAAAARGILADTAAAQPSAPTQQP